MLNFATIEYNNMLVTFGEQYLEDLYMKGKAEGEKASLSASDNQRLPKSSVSS